MIIDLHSKQKGNPGTRRLRADLAANGEWISRRRIGRLMKRNNLVGRHLRAYKVTTKAGSGHYDIPDLINHNFAPGAPDQRWCGDITYIKTATGWSYKAVVIDMGTRRPIGWVVENHMREDLAEEALKDALRRRGFPKGVIFHSDHGSVYTSLAFRRLCKRCHIRQSMGRTGVCWDNAVAESYFASYKKELIFTRPWMDIDEVRRETFKWVEHYYCHDRRHSSLGYLTPIEYELYNSRDYELAA